MNEIVVLGDELHYAISYGEIMWGGLLLALTMVIHGSGMVMTLRVANRLKQTALGKRPSFFFGLGILVVAAWMIILVNLVEVGVWASFYVAVGAIPNPSRAYYYALVNFCTLNSGYLPMHWRLLEGMLGMAGYLTFAWSTGILFTLAQEFQERHVGHKSSPTAETRAAQHTPAHHRTETDRTS
jgi:hypothetical protein